MANNTFKREPTGIRMSPCLWGIWFGIYNHLLWGYLWKLFLNVQRFLCFSLSIFLNKGQNCMPDFLWYIHLGGFLVLAKDTSFTRRSCQASKCLCWSFHFRWPHRMWENLLLGEWHLLARAVSWKAAVLNAQLKCPMQINGRGRDDVPVFSQERKLKPLGWYFLHAWLPSLQFGFLRRSVGLLGPVFWRNLKNLGHLPLLT